MNADVKSRLNDLLAKTTLEVIRQTFIKIPANERKSFRVSSLTDNEALAFLDVWKGKGEIAEFANTIVVVASDAGDAFPHEFRADPSSTITTYRNGIEDGGGLVFVETKVESDAQGLKNLFTLRDSNFLDGSFDDEDFSTSVYAAATAAHDATGREARSESLLVQRCTEVLRALRSASVPVPFRKYLTFLIAASQRYADLGEAVTPAETEEIIGDQLIALDMFGDTEWRAAASEQRVQRRLTQNLLHAELASSPSTDLDPDKLIETCRKTMFRDADGEELEPSEQHRWRAICIEYCRNPVDSIRRQIPYRIFEQLFASDVTGLKLGERVEHEIQAAGPERIPEFQELSVRQGLDRREQAEAERFLDTRPVRDEDLGLREILTPSTRRMVEKVAYPALEQFTNPLIKLAETAKNFFTHRDNIDSELEIRMILGRGGEKEAPSTRLLAFLYGAALKSVSEASKLSTDGFSFEVDPCFLEAGSPPEVIEPEDEAGDGDKDAAVSWDAVPVGFILKDAETGYEVDAQLSIAWHPPDIERLALYWLMLSASDAPQPSNILAIPNEIESDHWINSVAARLTPLGSCIVGHVSEDIRQGNKLSSTLDAAFSLREHCRDGELSAEILSDHFDAWEAALAEAKNELVTAGSQHPEVSAILAGDSIAESDGESLLLLPTHPLKSRWIAGYLRESQKLATRALEGTLPLNSCNEEYYLRWISNLTPGQQPPVHVSPTNHLLFAEAESGWIERYSPVAADEITVAGDGVHPGSVQEISRQIVSYLEAHPYKREGLSVLIVSPVAPRLPADLVREIRKGDWRDVQLRIHFVTRKNCWERATTYFEALPTENRMTGGDILFPPLDLQLYELEADGMLPESAGGLSVDLAVVPHLLNEKAQEQPNTSPEGHTTGGFDSVLEQPTYVAGGSDGGAISVVQRPMNPDPALYNWSSLVLRQIQLSPVSPTQPENDDYFQLQIKFQSSKTLFTILHRIAHWVVILERYISREQIEALDNRPEILTIKENVGPGGRYTLVVSSNVGKEFIVERLERKLKRIAADAGDPDTAGLVERELAEKVFDETRIISPLLALKALGISRVTEEILGLMIGRRLVEASFPMKLEKGLVAWLSLDEHQNWFGGTAASRADLCRISFDMSGDRLQVDLTVLESKLRKSGFDSHGIVQVGSTLDLFGEILDEQFADNDQRKIDGPVWRESLLSAIESLSPHAVCGFGLGKELSPTGSYLSQEVVTAFRNGEFRLRSLHGLYSICLYGERGTAKTWQDDRRDEITIAKSYADSLLGLVREERETATTTGVTAAPSNAPGGAKTADVQDWSNTGTDTPSSADRSELKPPVMQTPLPLDTSPFGPEIETEEKKTVDVTEDEEANPPAIALGSPRGRLSIFQLTERYQQILDVFGEYSINVQKPESEDDWFSEGPASVIYRVRPALKVPPDKVMSQGSALKMRLGLAADQEIGFRIGNGLVNIDVPKRPDERYFIDTSQLWSGWAPSKDKLEISLGLDTNGGPVIFDFSSSSSPHLLIGGTTGSGKSVALNTILGGAVTYYGPEELRLMLIDPKQVELVDLEDLDHLEGEIGSDAEDAIILLKKAVREMEDRYTRFKETKKELNTKSIKSLAEFNRAVDPDQRMPRWLIVLDEYADLTSDKSEKQEIEICLKRLAQKARAAGIHVIIATQKPSGEVISTNVRSNLPAQLALRVKSATESRVLMDEGGAELLNGMGDAYLKTANGTVRVQCARFDGEF